MFTRIATYEITMEDFFPELLSEKTKNRLKAENILKHFLPPSFLFLDHSVGRQNWLGACSWLKCCRGAALRNFQHIFITKKLCIHIEFSKFWLLEYLKSAKLHPRWRILNEKGKNIGRVNCCEWMYGQKRWWLKFPVCCIDDKGKVYCRRPPQTTNLSPGLLEKSSVRRGQFFYVLSNGIPSPYSLLHLWNP